ncbi:MAG: lysophospholipid acyltransferase family protein [Pseudomonadota bacterium]|nr:lysophospholipid acyltransferase family protein [Pseudomonadota bacterium]
MDPRDLLVAALARVPLRVANGAAWGIAWLWWWVLPIRRREAVEALAASLPEVAPRRVLTRMMHDLALGYVELLQFDKLTITVEGAEGLPPGALLLGGHGGSWDVALLAWADAFPLAIFLRTPSDPWTRRFLAGHRARHDLVALETGATMDDAYAALEAGRAVFFVQDQRHAKGIPSPFFGRTARTSAGIAAALLKTGRPVWGAWQHRVGVGRHHLCIERLRFPPATNDRAADIQAITDATNAWYEARIRAYPHGWLWLHRRWR